MFNSDEYSIDSYKQEMHKSFSKETRNKIQVGEEKKTWIHTLSNKALRGTVANRTLPSLHGWSLEIPLTVPSICNCTSIPLEVCSPATLFNFLKYLIIIVSYLNRIYI